MTSTLSESIVATASPPPPLVARLRGLPANFTIFDRAERRLTLPGIRALEVDDPAVAEAADILGLK